MLLLLNSDYMDGLLKKIPVKKALHPSIKESENFFSLSITESFEIWPCLKYYMYTNGSRQTNLLFPPRSYYQVVVVLVTLEWEKFGLRDPKAPKLLLVDCCNRHENIMMCVYIISVFPQFCGFLFFRSTKRDNFLLVFLLIFFSGSGLFFHPKSFEFAFPKQYFFNSRCSKF